MNTGFPKKKVIHRLWISLWITFGWEQGLRPAPFVVVVAFEVSDGLCVLWQGQSFLEPSQSLLATLYATPEGAVGINACKTLESFHRWFSGELELAFELDFRLKSDNDKTSLKYVHHLNPLFVSVLPSLVPVIILITRVILSATTDKVKSRHAEKIGL
jgi:hypothetical protein